LSGGSGGHPVAKQQRVEHSADAFAVRGAVQELAQQVGFSHIESVEIAIAASELTSNILKYGVRGWVRVEVVDDLQRGRGLCVSAFDQGPPFHDFAQALEDGSDQDGPLDPVHLLGRGGIASGLGAVRRLSDAMGWEPTEGGKKVWMIRYRTRAHPPGAR
jgi:anti-sigma regulatory factor (Ser/Thr protein kinase)